MEVPPRPRHPEPDLFSALRRIERLPQVEDSSSRRCQVLPAEHRETADVVHEKDKLHFFLNFNTSYLCDSVLEITRDLFT